MSNSFLKQLQNLQQDGSAAISGPSNWRDAPLLEIKTELHGVIDEVATTFLSEITTTTTWLFLIGSPGNGKSTAIGHLYRVLTAEHDCAVTDEKGCDLGDLGEQELPYEIEVRESGKPFISGLIVQDASVVKEPFAHDVDPARDLIASMERCSERGIGLVVCTNRGVLEKVHSAGLADKEVRKKPWWRVVKWVVEEDAKTTASELQFNSTGKRKVFDSAIPKAIALDSRSLVYKSNDLNQLIENATQEGHWEPCSECDVENVCPFRANQRWLADSEIRTRFIEQMRRAEVYSGQIIVFREAGALLSVLLSGCPKDYQAGDPCHWVKQLVSSFDWCALMTRKLYSILLIGWAPSGLEEQHQKYPTEIRKWQKSNIQKICDLLETKDAGKTFSELRTITSPSTALGLERLLGREGALTALDPMYGYIPTHILDRWDTDVELLIDDDSLDALEKKFVKACAEAERALAEDSTHEATDAYWVLKRYLSGHLIRRAAWIEGLSRHDDALTDFLKLLDIVGKPREQRADEERQTIVAYRRFIDEFMARLERAEGGSEGIRIYENVRLTGNWTTSQLRVDITPDSDGSVALRLDIGKDANNRPLESANVHADVFVWLYELAKNGLDSRCMSEEMLASAIEAKIRAARRSSYAGINDEIGVNIETTYGRYSFVREGGEVVAERDSWR